METSLLIYRANQWSGFFIIGTSVMKELKAKEAYEKWFDSIMKVTMPCETQRNNKNMFLWIISIKRCSNGMIGNLSFKVLKTNKHLLTFLASI